MRKVGIYLGTSTKSFKATPGRGVCVLDFPGAAADAVSGRYAYNASRVDAEAMLLLVGLESLRRGARCGFAVEAHTESEQLRTALTRWLPKWRESGWLNSKGQPVAAHWSQLADLMASYAVTVQVGRHEYSGWMEAEMKRRDDGWVDIGRLLESKEGEKDGQSTGD